MHYHWPVITFHGHLIWFHYPHQDGSTQQEEPHEHCESSKQMSRARSMQGEQRKPELECELSAYLFVTCFGVLIDSFLFRLPLSLCRPRLTCVLELELEQISEMLACQLIHHLCLVSLLIWKFVQMLKELCCLLLPTSNQWIWPLMTTQRGHHFQHVSPETCSQLTTSPIHYTFPTATQHLCQIALMMMILT